MSALIGAPALEVTGPLPEAFAISTFPAPALTSTTPTKVSVTPAELVAMLTTHERRRNKNGRGWSGATYKAGTTRANDNVVEWSVAVGDFDHLTLDEYLELRERLSNLGLSFILYSTFQSTETDFRFRVVLFLTKPVPAGRYPEIWLRTNAHVFGGKNDPNTKDASRMVFTPAAPEGVAVVAEQRAGFALDWTKLPPVPSETVTPIVGDVTRGAIDHLGYKTLDFVANGAPIGEQRGRALGATRAYLSAGYSIEETAEKVWQGLQNSPCGEAAKPWTYKDAVGLAEDLARRQATALPGYAEFDVSKIPGTHMNGAGPAPLNLIANGTSHEVESISAPGHRPPTDLGNTERLIDRFGDQIRYSKTIGEWLHYDGRYWKIDTAHHIVKLAKQVVRDIYREAAEANSKEERRERAAWARRSESSARIEAMISLARSAVPVQPSELDRNPWALNVTNGTIDLRTGMLGPHRREDFITKLIDVAYVPDATAPRWQAFLKEILPSESVRGFIRRAAGYSASGSARERKLIVGFGNGQNGKGVTLQTLRKLLGDYAVRTPSETFLTRKSDAIPNDVAQLRGARFVFASETNEGRRLAEATVKDMTGGEDISARFMRGEWFSFAPTFTPWLATNHRPEIRGTDPAIWDRIALVPFTVRIAEERQDRALGEKLEAEFPGILAWVVAGAVEWYREGLGVPSEVKEATANYRRDMDLIADFLEDQCVIDEQAWALSSTLYESYRAWCETSGERPMTQTALGRRLVERGFRQTRLGPKQARTWSGLRMRGPDESPQTRLGVQTRLDAEIGINPRNPGARVENPKNASNVSMPPNASEEPRDTVCWRCTRPVSTASEHPCDACGWLRCPCGACSEGCEPDEPSWLKDADYATRDRERRIEGVAP